MKPLITIRKALADQNLLGCALEGDSWAAWRVLLIAAMGEPLKDSEREVFKRLTGGREREAGERADELVAVVGRRGGKSRAMSVLATYLAALCEHPLVPGERGVLLPDSAGPASGKDLAGLCGCEFRAVPHPCSVGGEQERRHP